MGPFERGRQSSERKAWSKAYAELSAADLQTPLGLDDLESLAAAAYLSGRDQESEETWGRTHQESLDGSCCCPSQSHRTSDGHLALRIPASAPAARFKGTRLS